MRKNSVQAGIAAIVVLIVYHLIAFLVPFQKTEVFWISYVFSLIAFVVVGISVYIAFVKNSSAKSRFYGFPIARIGLYYGFFQMLVGFVFMAWGPIIPWWVAVLAFGIAMGLAILGLVGAGVVRDEIDEQDEKLQQKVSLMRSLQSKVNQMVSQCKEYAAAGAVRALADEIRYSDPVSNTALDEIEAQLVLVISELQDAIASEESSKIMWCCEKAKNVLNERNRLCKLNKG